MERLTCFSGPLKMNNRSGRSVRRIKKSEWKKYKRSGGVMKQKKI